MARILLQLWGMQRTGFILTIALVAGCGDSAKLTLPETSGVEPAIPEPNTSLLPVINIAPARGWSDGATPSPGDGLAVTAFAQELEHPRWLYVLPNGDVLVAETAAPERPDDGGGISGWIMGIAMKRAGSAVPSANRISLLRDENRDGEVDVRTVFIDGLNSPFGMELVGDTFYVANTDALMRYPYRRDATSIEARGEKVADLPGGTLNHHWTKNVIASPDGSRLFVTVGSNSNIAENGLDKEEQRAAILEIDPATGRTTLFASGLRNPNGLAWHPDTGTLWTTVNERDGLGSDLVPDYLTSVMRGGFYGWPYSYFGGHVDDRVEPPRPDLVAKAIVPEYALGPHTASLGLALYTDGALPARYWDGAFIGQHGSWNREPLSGYKVIFVPFENGKPTGKPLDVLTGFVDVEGAAQGRPVGVAIDATGALLVADDVGNTVWRVTAAGS